MINLHVDESMWPINQAMHPEHIQGGQRSKKPSYTQNTVCSIFKGEFWKESEKPEHYYFDLKNTKLEIADIRRIFVESVHITFKIDY